MTSDEKDWFQPKRYVHIGLPLTHADRRRWVESYVRNEAKVAVHAFKPLIHKIRMTPKYVKEGERKVRKVKSRHICYATHLDSAVYSYYSRRILGPEYEKWLSENGLEKSVIAYRSIPLDPPADKGNKCHIHFAKEVFEQVVSGIEKEDVCVIIADITGFFDNMDHAILKREWSGVMRFGEGRLPADHYNLFKNLTRFSFIDEADIFRLFQTGMISQTPGSRNISSRNVKKRRYIYDKEKAIVAYCVGSAGMKRIREAKNLIKTSIDGEGRCGRGIPQGLPISAMLANIYMRPFDMVVGSAVTDLGGIYRRYSDDIAIVVPMRFRESVERILRAEIEKMKLEISPAKMKVCRFARTKDGSINVTDVSEGGRSTECVLSYLGFTFDGRDILLKSSGICRYYDKMRRQAERQLRYASTIHNHTKGKIFYNKMIRRFTYAGSRKSRIWRYDIKASKEAGRSVFKPTDAVKFGNYLTYVNRCAAVMGGHHLRKICHQLSGNQHILSQVIRDMERRLADIR